MLQLFFRICRTHDCIEFFDPGSICREGSGSVFSHWDFVEPCIKILVTKLVNVGVAVNLDVVPRLSDISAIKHIQETLTFQKDRQLVIDKVKKNVGRFLIQGCDSKIINLTFEYDLFASDGARVQTWLVDGRSKAKIMENCVGVFLSETGQFRVALHC
jgi:hypothetical protein